MWGRTCWVGQRFRVDIKDVNIGMDAAMQESTGEDALCWVHQEDMLKKMVQASLREARLATRLANRPKGWLVVDRRTTGCPLNGQKVGPVVHGRRRKEERRQARLQSSKKQVLIQVGS